MKKLELKHIVGYLPYGLKIDSVNGVKYTLCDKGGLSNLSIGDFMDNTDIYSPILRPLSDLTKEIEHKGENFIPNELLNERFRPSDKDLVPYKYSEYNLELEIQTQVYSQTIDLFDGHLIVLQLLEWHFDIHGLIQKGLAIDINNIVTNA